MIIQCQAKNQAAWSQESKWQDWQDWWCKFIISSSCIGAQYIMLSYPLNHTLGPYGGFRPLKTTPKSCRFRLHLSIETHGFWGFPISRNLPTSWAKISWKTWGTAISNTTGCLPCAKKIWNPGPMFIMRQQHVQQMMYPGTVFGAITEREKPLAVFDVQIVQKKNMAAFLHYGMDPDGCRNC